MTLKSKRISLIFITLFVALFLSACGGQQTDEPQDSSELDPNVVEEAEPVVDPTPEPMVEEQPVEDVGDGVTVDSEENVEDEDREETIDLSGQDINPKNILIAQISSGAAGNNNYDFIALYNNTGFEVDLNGYRLMYQARPTDEPEMLYRWREFTPFVDGFYVLSREGELFPFFSDATFDMQVFNRGSLFLMDGNDKVADFVGWGDMPEGTYNGLPAPKIPRGATLVRKLEPPFTGVTNFDLFEVSAEPKLVSCDSGLVEIEMPSEVAPGAEFTISIQISEPDAIERLEVLIPSGFSAGGGAPFGEPVYQTFEAPLTQTQIISLKAPNTLQSAVFRGSKAIINGKTICLPGTQVAVDGVLPIGVARSLINQTVTIEGIATMYTDGFYAGSSGTKFYIADETGGVQVYVPGGKGGVSVELGDRVRVTGKTEYYRSSLEVIPSEFESQIEVIEAASDQSAQSAPLPVDLTAVRRDAALIGKLVEVTGIVDRVEEFNFSYEIDIVDENGRTLPVYLDKLTEVSVLELNEGDQYTIAGIVESWDDNIRLNPRIQTDFARVWPETIRVEVIAPSALSLGPISYQLKITNDTSETHTDILVSAPRPEGEVETVIVDNGVTATREVINWLIPQLESGQSVTLNMEVALGEPDQAQANSGQVLFFPAEVSSDQLAETVMSEGKAVYTNGILPIWAIQGSGAKSAYIGEAQTTAGIVTGIFPELNGLFIQTQNDDQKISTSDGLFVSMGEVPMLTTLTTGMQVNVFGTITELSGQTTIEIEEAEHITIISNTDLLETLAPQPLTPPADGNILDYFEAREGMLVSLDGYAVAVGPTNRFGEFPLYPLSLSENLYPNAPLIFRDSADNSSDGIIFVDDGSEAEYESGSEIPLPVATGDIVSNVTGPLAFTFGNYKIEPISPANIIVEPSTYAEKGLTAPEERNENQLSIATFNVENFFDILNPHPSSPPAPTREEYQQKLTKLAASFEVMGYPEIVGLQEVENSDVLEDLAERIIEVGGPSYQVHLLEGSDSRGIDVAYMTRADKIEPITLEQRPDPEGTLSREPLVLQVRASLSVGDQDIFLINNHFTSLAGGEEATLPRRTAQAEWNAGLVEEISSNNPNAHVIVMGDLNSFRFTPPLERLELNLTHVYDGLEDSSPAYPTYTYIFEGVAQTLDHILVSDDLISRMVNVIALPINADYPMALENDESPYRVSDHNPLIAIFDFSE